MTWIRRRVPWSTARGRTGFMARMVLLGVSSRQKQIEGDGKFLSIERSSGGRLANSQNWQGVRPGVRPGTIGEGDEPRQTTSFLR